MPRKTFIYTALSCFSKVSFFFYYIYFGVLNFDDALEIAKLREQGKWKKKIRMYLGEFLLFGRGSKLDQVEGKQLFDQCLADNPADSAVLHKVAKLCHNVST